MDIVPLIISLAKTKWHNFVEIVRKNEIQLTPEDWNTIYSLSDACNSCPETVVTEIKKLENRYLEKYTEIPKILCMYPGRRTIPKFDPIPRGSK